jgi:hypothetical protein
MIYFTELDSRRQGDMYGVLLLSSKKNITGH